MDTLPVDTSTTTEQAQRAVKAFRTMQPSLTAFARALTGNSKCRVEIAAGKPRTDGNRILYRPPLALGSGLAHQKSVCDVRDDETLLQTCPACRVEEEVYAMIYHEISHIAFGTFAQTSEKDQRQMLDLALAQVSSKYADAVRDKIANMAEYMKESYMGLANQISPFLPTLINVLEDLRVDARMFDARPGTRKMYDATVMRMFREGVEIADGSYVKWSDAPLNGQVIVGLLCLGAGYKYEGWFHRDVEDALADEELRLLIAEHKKARKMHDSYRISFKILEQLRKLGFCKAETDPTEEEQESDEESDSADPVDSTSDDSDTDTDDSDTDTNDSEDDSQNEEVTDEPTQDNDPVPDSPDTDPGSGSDVPEDEPEEDGSTEETVDGTEDVPPQEGGTDPETSDVGDEPQSDEDSAPEETGKQGDSQDDSGPSEDNGTPSGVPDKCDGEGDSDPDDHSEGSPSEDGSSNQSGQDDSASSGDGSGSQGTELDSESDPDDNESIDETGSSGGDDQEESDDSDSGDQDASGDDDTSTGESQSGSGSDREDETDIPDGDSLPEHTEGGEPQPPEPEWSDPMDGTQGTGDINPVDTGADPGHGGADGGPSPEMGKAEDLAEIIEVFTNHTDIHEMHVPETDVDPERNKGEVEKALDMAVMQGMYFETSSVHIKGVNIFKDRNRETEGWRYGYREFAESRLRLHGISASVDVPESILGPATLVTRRTFDDNKRAKNDRNRKSGRIRGASLAKRAPFDDPRMFGKKTIPSKKSYSVVIGVDVSASTLGQNLALAKRAAMAQAELCHRTGIDFAVYCHSSGHDDGVTLDIYECKSFDDPWDDRHKGNLASIAACSGNLDGHSIEFYRKLSERTDATDKIILYYSDGKMPAENHDEELEILQREIQHCRKRGISLMGVGIRTDSPSRHGLDTVQVDTDDDLIRVVQHLGKKLLRADRN